MSALQGIDYAAIAPILTAAGAAVLVLVADAVVPARTAPLRVGMAGAAGAAAAALLAGPGRQTFCVGPSCSYVTDRLSIFFAVLFCVAAAGALLLSWPIAAEERVPAGEYAFLLLCSLTGMLTLAGARDLVTIIVAVEVLTLPIYALAGLRRADRRSAEAALKFFLVSVVSTAITLFGASLIYGLTGSLYLDRIAAALAGRPELRHLPLTSAAVFLVLVGFAFKVAAVPFHWWAPDTYQGAPLPVAAYLSTASKAAGFAAILLVVLEGFRPYAATWGLVLAVLAVATMSVGNLIALRQRHMVRLLAWSSVAQAGYMLAPLGVAVSPAGRTDASLAGAASATLAYLGFYVVINLGAFSCVVAAARQAPRTALEDFRGLARRSPVTAAALALFLIALAGLPPGLAGLFAKIAVFRATISGGAVWLAVVVAVNTVVGLYYYIRVAASLFAAGAEPAGELADGGDADRRSADRVAAAGALVRPPVVASRAVQAAIALTAAGTIAVGFAPQLVFGATGLISLHP